MTTTKERKIPAIMHKPIEIKSWKGRQSAHYQQIAELDSFKIKITIQRDSFNFQSSAHGYVWSDTTLTWNLVYSIPYPLMNVVTTDKFYEKMVEADFTRDAAVILTGMKSILLK